MQNCPICNGSRWKDLKIKGKKVANKVVHYFPLIPRLQRLYKSRHTEKWMTWHSIGKSKENSQMNHPVDGKAWKFFDIIHSEFAKDPRNIRLGLAADGFNPFGNLSQSYSMWPVIMTTYNTPPWICMKETYFMLTMLIPGPKSPTKDIDVFLQPLIKELQTLWSGVWTRDVVTGTDFKMKATLLWTINDFPARSSLYGWSGQGYLACPTCNKDTPSAKVVGLIFFNLFLPDSIYSSVLEGVKLALVQRLEDHLALSVPELQFLSLIEKLIEANHPQSSVLGHALVGGGQFLGCGVRLLIAQGYVAVIGGGDLYWTVKM
ncbi:CACTA transposable element [Tanacetum coccineum]